jgi:hypothetical protein
MVSYTNIKNYFLLFPHQIDKKNNQVSIMCFDSSRNVTYENNFFSFMDVLLKNVTMVTEVENLRVVFQAKKEQL